MDDCAFCMEHTGTYGLLFYGWLAQQGILFCVESGLHIKRSLGMTRGKNDAVDAERIADYALTHKAKLKPYEMPSPLLVKIKQLLTYREQMEAQNPAAADQWLQDFMRECKSGIPEPELKIKCFQKDFL